MIKTYSVNDFEGAISANKRCVFESCSWRGVLDTTLCDKVCQWLPTGRWISPGTPFTSTNTTDRHDIIEILLKMVLSTITPSPFNEYVNKRLRYTNSISLFNINHWCLTLNSKTRISTQYTYDVHPYNWTRPMIPCNRWNQGGVPCSKATCEIYSLISLYRL